MALLKRCYDDLGLILYAYEVVYYFEGQGKFSCNLWAESEEQARDILATLDGFPEGLAVVKKEADVQLNNYNYEVTLNALMPMSEILMYVRISDVWVYGCNPDHLLMHITDIIDTGVVTGSRAVVATS